MPKLQDYAMNELKKIWCAAHSGEPEVLIQQLHRSYEQLNCVSLP